MIPLGVLWGALLVPSEGTQYCAEMLLTHFCHLKYMHTYTVLTAGQEKIHPL